MKDPLFWKDGKLHILDQRELPHREQYIVTDRLEDVEMAIKTLAVRGAPNIGLTALYGAFIAIVHCSDFEIDRIFREGIDRLSRTRPTAYDLFGALKRAETVFSSGSSPEKKRRNILDEAHRLKDELVERSRKIGQFGAAVVPENATILTHCNTGTLAAPGDGTALSVIIEAHRQGKVKTVYADETRPLLQGSRLTMWELMQRNIPATVIVDSSAGLLMRMGMIDFIVTGADRIARNGDTANKIGTYTLAVLAKENGIPFYITAPSNTIDIQTATGEDIEIERRNSEEVTAFWKQAVAPNGANSENYAFDVTPASLIRGIITEKGILSPDNISI